jgi:hypothetical protein
MNKTQQTMLKGLKRRSEEAKSIKKIDNSSLYAGSPMHYYCKLCELHTATLPETHWEPAPKYCEPCKAMIAAGFDPNAKQFG